jgi:methyl-accepting chemotaxis protein
MAKRGRRKGSASLNSTAEQIGRALGQVAARLETWKQQREEIRREVQHLMSTAQRMLADLGQTAQTVRSTLGEAVEVRRRGRRKGYKMSAATRRKLREAWARRKAAAAAKAKGK